MAVVINGTTGIDTIQDDVVGLAQMASGTDGNLITYDASGNPAAVAVGTLGQVLTSNGAGAAPTMQAGGDNTPSFAVKRSTTQSISDSTWTKVQFDSEDHDTDSAYDNVTNYRFTVPVGKAGKYQINAAIYYDSASISSENSYLQVRKNGSGIWFLGTQSTALSSKSVSHTLTLAEGDYIEVFVIHYFGTAVNLAANYSLFSGFKLSGV